MILACMAVSWIIPHFPRGCCHHENGVVDCGVSCHVRVPEHDRFQYDVDAPFYGNLL